MRYSAYFLLLLLPLSASQAADHNWQLKRNAGGIKIMQQATDTGHVITRGSFKTTSTIDALVTLIRDNSACQRWLYSCRKSKLIKQLDGQKRLDYIVVDSPLLFADRDMYAHSELSYNRATKTALLKISGRENYDKGKKGKVRIKALQGYWKMKQLSDGQVAVDYQIYSNPQMSPSRILSNHLVDSVSHTLRNLAKVSKESKYQSARLQILSH